MKWHFYLLLYKLLYSYLSFENMKHISKHIVYIGVNPLYYNNPLNRNKWEHHSIYNYLRHRIHIFILNLHMFCNCTDIFNISLMLNLNTLFNNHKLDDSLSVKLYYILNNYQKLFNIFSKLNCKLNNLLCQLQKIHLNISNLELDVYEHLNR